MHLLSFIYGRLFGEKKSSKELVKKHTNFAIIRKVKNIKHPLKDEEPRPIYYIKNM